MPLRTIFQNKGSWLLQPQTYSGSKAGVSVAEADSEEEAHLGTLGHPESVFSFDCVRMQRDQPLW